MVLVSRIHAFCRVFNLEKAALSQKLAIMMQDSLREWGRGRASEQGISELDPADFLNFQEFYFLAGKKKQENMMGREWQEVKIEALHSSSPTEGKARGERERERA
eukprot:c23017_g1_i3 orf=1-312(-)